MRYHYIKDKDWRWNMPGYQWTRTFTTESGMTMQVVGIDVQRMMEYHFEHGRRQKGVRALLLSLLLCFFWRDGVWDRGT